MRKVIAAQVAEEVSKQSGYEVEIEDREMAMLTPNEVKESKQEETQTNNNNEISND
jgi:hypothetical protein